MIRIVKHAAPAVLLDRGMAETQLLCADYQKGARTFKFKSALYGDESVKNALLEAQHKKCAFCESFVRHISYGDVEHFRPKAGYKQTETDQLRQPGYYWLAYSWENLFFCCQLCNQRFKRNLFPLKDGRRRARSHTHRLDKEEPLLIDPSRRNPADLLEFRAERAHAIGGCPEGETTIEVLGLNRAELVEARGRRLQMLGWLVQTNNLLSEKIAATPTPECLQQRHKLEQLLMDSTEAASEYAAMIRAFLNSAGQPASGV